MMTWQLHFFNYKIKFTVQPVSNFVTKIRALLFTVLFCPVVFAQSVSEYYEKALLAFNSDDIQESYIYLKNALQQDPNHLPSKLLMGRVLLIDGYVNDAIDEFEESILGGTDKNLVVVPLSRAYLMLSYPHE